jgi:hypothetical protein
MVYVKYFGYSDEKKLIHYLSLYHCAIVICVTPNSHVLSPEKDTKIFG